MFQISQGFLFCRNPTPGRQLELLLTWLLERDIRSAGIGQQSAAPAAPLAVHWITYQQSEMRNGFISLAFTASVAGTTWTLRFTATWASYKIFSIF